MFSSLIKWKKFPKFDAGANDAKDTENWKFTERKVDVPVVQREQSLCRVKILTIRKCRRRWVEHPDCTKT